MTYFQVYIPGAQDLFTWESDEALSRGDLVELLFRKKPVLGLIVKKITNRPEFKTQRIEKVLQKAFIPEISIDLADFLAEICFCSTIKVLNLMIPEGFFLSKNPVQREIIIKVNPQALPPQPKGKLLELYNIILNTPEGASEKKLKDSGYQSSLKNLITKGILLRNEGNILSRISFESVKEKLSLFSLTPLQEKAREIIEQTKKSSLLFGVTGSGKTEIYKYLTQKALLEKKQVLILVPEIALSDQLWKSFASYFGKKASFWHSKMSAQEKIQEWARIQSTEAQVIIGTRSSALIPIPQLGLFIIDEAHEWTYKNEFTPRFWAQDIADFFQREKNVKVVYGSATPSTELWQKVKNGALELATLPQKVLPTHKADIQLVDLRQEIKRGNYSPLSERLESALHQTIDQGKQVVLFLNRRGFSSLTLCEKCGHQFECPHCSQFLKWHQTSENHKGKLICHLCGTFQDLPEKCPECGKSHFLWRGWGTQRLEGLLAEKFPGKKILRADRDSTGGKYDFQNLLKEFSEGKSDILLGTQMITKGLDFENVGLVGVILGDIGLSLPDFRAQERVFQQLIQVTGRTGRRGSAGKILIQTFHPDLPFFEYVRNEQVVDFLEKDLLEREKIGLPPFSKIIKIIISHAQKEIALKKAREIFQTLKRILEGSIYETHWAPAFWPKMHGKYHFHVFIQGPGEMSFELKDFLKKIANNPHFKIDAAPASLL